MGYLDNENILFPVLTRNDKDIDLDKLKVKDRDKILDVYNITLDLVSLAPCLYHTEEGVEICIVGEVENFHIDIHCCCSYRETILKALSKSIGGQFETSAFPYQYDKNVSIDQLKIDIDQYLPIIINQIENFDYKSDRRYILLNTDNKS